NSRTPNLLNLQSTKIIFNKNQIEAMTLADRIVIMRDGNIEQIGTPTEVYEAPATTFVARFIGSPSMNMLEGTVNGGRLSAPGIEGTEVAAPAGPVVVGIRPDDLVVADGAGLELVGRVVVVEPLGPEALVYVNVAGQELIGKSPGRKLPGIGREVSLRVAPNRLHLFNANTGHVI
ncbi:MAG: TOBE domain-containing protein, partial [Pseudomonadota bacterium]